MDTVDRMRVFVRVAQRAGFAVAARELRVSPAAVTKQIAALEARVGARLLERTTRRVALTEAGRGGSTSSAVSSACRRSTTPRRR